MSPSHWGPPFWVFFHALSVNLTEEKYNTIKPQLMGHFKRLCSTLPCPDCSQHALEYLAKITIPPTLHDFKVLLWAFHNTVNSRTNKPILPFEKLQMYKNAPLFHLFMCFKIAYSKRAYNPSMIAHNMSKMRNLTDFSTWSMDQKLYHNNLSAK